MLYNIIIIKYKDSSSSSEAQDTAVYNTLFVIFLYAVPLSASRCNIKNIKK